MTDLKSWQRLAENQRFIHAALIAGKPHQAQSGETFAVINPATHALLANVAACSDAEVDLAVGVARKSFESGQWARMQPKERKAILLRLSELILAHREELALLDSLSMGKPVMDAYSIDVPGAAHVFAWYAESLDKLYDQVAPTGPGTLATITRVPLYLSSRCGVWM